MTSPLFNSDRDSLASRLQPLLRALWFVVIPALLAFMVVRYLAPRYLDQEELVVARLAAEHTFVLAMALFVGFVALLRYWRAYLPGGRYLFSLPPALAQWTPRQDLEEFSNAIELHRSVSEPRSLLALKERLGDARATELESALAELLAALQAGDSARVKDGAARLSSIAQPELRLRAHRQMVSSLSALAIAVVLALLVRQVGLQSYRVIGGSMLPTFTPGDQILAKRSAYGIQPPFVARRFVERLPRRGDVIVFKTSLPNAPDDLVKRVVGLPGDRVSVVSGHPIINGWRVPSCDVGPYAFPTADLETRGRIVVEFLGTTAYLVLRAPTFGGSEPYVVQPGEVYVLGDNRNASADSRAWNAGVPVSDIEGKVDRFLFHQMQDGAPNPRTFFASLNVDLHLEALDARYLEEAVKNCLAARPAQTEPPAADASSRQVSAETPTKNSRGL